MTASKDFSGNTSGRLTSVSKGQGGSDVQYSKVFWIGDTCYRWTHIETGIGSNTTKTINFSYTYGSKPYFAVLGILAPKDLDEAVLINNISAASITIFQSNATTVRVCADIIGET